MQEKIDRNKFLKLLAYLFILPFIYIMNRTIKDYRKFKPGSREFRISEPPPGLSISGPIIISRSENELKVFSARCTHLGCMINKIENEEIICPCHGSRYDKNGIPVKGPSVTPLSQLNYGIDDATREIIVKLS